VARGWLPVLLLVASLILNAVTLARVGELRQQVEWLASEVSSVESTAWGIQSTLSQVAQDLAQVEAEQQWLAGADWQVDEEALADVCPDAVPVTIQWTLRELAPDAVVSLEVRPEGGAAWQSHPAEKTGELAYRAQASLDPRQSWEYRVVARGASSIRASSPRPLAGLEELTAKAVQVQRAEMYQTGEREWMRYVLQDLGSGGAWSACSRVVRATLEMVLDDQVLSTAEMTQGRSPAPLPAEGGTSTNLLADYMTEDSDPFYDDALWTGWVEIPDWRSKARARVTFGDGEELLLPVPGYCCPPKGW
jgi:hypothetical protein